MENVKHYFETNKKSWNARIAIHTKSAMYDLEAFKKGKTSLNDYELNALGNVNCKTILHLQCHFGQDTLSFSRLGAVCTGIDLSDEGITYAQALNTELKLNAKFKSCNVYDVSKHITEQFNIVYTSYGVIGWLPDLKSWAKIIYDRLQTGGIFYMVEFHPIVWMFDYLKTKPELKYAYHREAVVYETYQGTYADAQANITCQDYTWNHGLGKVVTALTEAGLHIDFLHEHDESPYNVLPDLISTTSGLFVTKNKLYPLIFEIQARKL